MKAKQGGTLLKGLKTEMVTPTLVGTVFSEILGYGRVVHTPMEGIRVVPCNQQKDCMFKDTKS
jgi:hypothetical protein